MSDDDATKYRAYHARMSRFADALAPFWQKTMPGIGNNSLGEVMTFAKLGLGLRRMGKRDMQEFLRVASLPMRDLMDENFDSELLKATLTWDGLIGSKMAPRALAADEIQHPVLPIQANRRPERNGRVRLSLC